MIKINEADLAKLKEAIRENTKQLEKLAEQVRQMSQATTIWGLAKSPEIDTEVKPDSYFDGKSIKEIEPPPLKGWLQRQQEMALEDERVFAALDNAGKEEKTTIKPKTVLFACVHNAGRSQIAATLFDNFADLTKASAISAGSNPALNIYPNVIEVMKEVNCDETYGRPQLLTEELTAQADLFVSMGCGEAGCPIIPTERIAWQIEDPKDQPIEKVRQIRDQIQKHVVALLFQRGWLREGLVGWARKELLFNKLIITPKNIERLILWRQALISRTTISQSMMEGAIALIHYQLHATHNFNVPEEYRTAHIQFMAYSQEDQETMIENTLIDNEIV